MTNKPASLVKRFTAFFIDLIIVVVIYYFFITFIANPVAEKTYGYNDKVSFLNEVVTEKVVEYGIGYEEDGQTFIYNAETYVIEKIEEYKKNNPNVEINEDALKEQYNSEFLTKYEACLESLNEDKEYIDTLTTITSIDMANFLFGTLLGELIIFLVVPLMTKKLQTVGQLLLKLVVVSKDDLHISKSKIIVRFLLIYFVVTFLSYIIFKNNFIYVIALLMGVLIVMTPNKQNFIDMLTKTKILEGDNARIFKTKEEKEIYDKSLKESA